MGTIQQDIHDLHSALDFFAGYATQEEVVPADYEVGLHHAGWVKLSDALNFARQQIGSRLQPTQISKLPADHRAAAVLWFVHTLSNRKGDALARIWTSLQSYPAEQLAEKFPNAATISEWVTAGAPPWGTPKALPVPESGPAPMMRNCFGVTEGAGLVLITAMSRKISCSEALNLAAHLMVVVDHSGASPVEPFVEFLKAAEANLGHAPTPEAKAAKPARKKRRKPPKGESKPT